MKPGEKFSLAIQATSEQEQELKVGGKVRNEKTKFDSNFQGTMTVAGVDAKGRETKFELLVEKWSASRDGAPVAEVLPAGTVITVDHAARQRFTAQAKLPPEAQEMLGRLFERHGKDTDDDTHGTIEKRKIGDTWEVSKALLDLFNTGPIRVEKLKGEVKLVRLADLQNKTCLEIESKVEGSDFVFEQGWKKSGHCSISAELGGRFPTDTADPSRSIRMVMKAQVEAEGTADSQPILKAKMSHTRNETRVLRK
jgi:hypothetical protein